MPTLIEERAGGISEQLTPWTGSPLTGERPTIISGGRVATHLDLLRGSSLARRRQLAKTATETATEVLMSPIGQVAWMQSDHIPPEPNDQHPVHPRFRVR